MNRALEPKNCTSKRIIIMVIALLVKVTKKLMGSALTICVLHKQEGLFNSHYMQHFSVNHLTTYEVAIS